MRETERRGRLPLIAAALTGAAMLALAGVLATAGLPGASLSATGMPLPGTSPFDTGMPLPGTSLFDRGMLVPGAPAARGSSIESAPATAPPHLSAPRRTHPPTPRSGAQPHPASTPPASPSSIPPSSAGPVHRTSGAAGTLAGSHPTPADLPTPSHTGAGATR